MSEDIFVCHNLGKWMVLLASRASELGMLLKLPERTRQPLTIKRFLVRSVSSVQFDKTCGRALRSFAKV